VREFGSSFTTDRPCGSLKFWKMLQTVEGPSRGTATAPDNRSPRLVYCLP